MREGLPSLFAACFFFLCSWVKISPSKWVANACLNACIPGIFGQCEEGLDTTSVCTEVATLRLPKGNLRIITHERDDYAAKATACVHDGWYTKLYPVLRVSMQWSVPQGLNTVVTVYLSPRATYSLASGWNRPKSKEQCCPGRYYWGEPQSG